MTKLSAENSKAFLNSHPRVDSSHELKDILLIAIWYELQHGYESQKMLESGESSTTTKARTLEFFNKPHDLLLQKVRIGTAGGLSNATAHGLLEKVDDVIAYVRKLPNVSPTDRMYNYFNDLRMAYQHSIDPDQKYKPSQIGLITSALGLYNQKLNEEEFKEMVGDSKHLGAIGDRGEWFVKLIGFREMFNDIGGYQYRVVNRLGDLGLFYSKHDFNIEISDCFLFSGRIKDHIEWKGVNQTVWSHVKIKENVGRAE